MVVSLGLVRPDWVMTVFDWTQSKRWPPLTPPLPPQEHTHTHRHTLERPKKRNGGRERERERENTRTYRKNENGENAKKSSAWRLLWRGRYLYAIHPYFFFFFLLRLRLLVPRCFFFRISPLCLCVRRIFMAGLEGLRSLLYNDGRPVR